MNGRQAKSGAQVKVGDTVTIEFGTKPLTVRVLSVAETVRKEEAAFMYEVVSE